MDHVARQREYELYRRMDLLAEVLDIPGWELPHADDDLRAMAEDGMEGEAKGKTMAFTMVVVVDQSHRDGFAMDTGRWTYRAILAKDTEHINGCEHTVHSSNIHWAAVDAVTLHRRQCMGHG